MTIEHAHGHVIFLTCNIFLHVCIDFYAKLIFSIAIIPCNNNDFESMADGILLEVWKIASEESPLYISLTVHNVFHPFSSPEIRYAINSKERKQKEREKESYICVCV